MVHEDGSLFSLSRMPFVIVPNKLLPGLNSSLRSVFLLHDKAVDRLIGSSCLSKTKMESNGALLRHQQVRHQLEYVKLFIHLFLCPSLCIFWLVSNSKSHTAGRGCVSSLSIKSFLRLFLEITLIHKSMFVGLSLQIRRLRKIKWRIFISLVTLCFGKAFAKPSSSISAQN